MSSLPSAPLFREIRKRPVQSLSEWNDIGVAEVNKQAKMTISQSPGISESPAIIESLACNEEKFEIKIVMESKAAIRYKGSFRAMVEKSFTEFDEVLRSLGDVEQVGKQVQGVVELDKVPAQLRTQPQKLRFPDLLPKAVE